MDKETLEKLNRIYGKLDGEGRVLMEKEFPELCESEDEKIRQDIIKLVNFYYGSSLICKHKYSKDNMISWLEKQKPVEWSEHQHKLLNYAKSMTDDTEVKNFLESLRGMQPNDQKWSEEDEKIRKGLINMLSQDKELHGAEINWLKSLKHCWMPSEAKKETKNKCPNYSEGYGCSTSPLKQCDTCPDYQLYNHWKPSKE